MDASLDFFILASSEIRMKKLALVLKIFCEVIREVFLVNFFLVLTLIGCFLLFLLGYMKGKKTT